jgi:hypothetical protein
MVVSSRVTISLAAAKAGVPEVTVRTVGGDVARHVILDPDVRVLSDQR